MNCCVTGWCLIPYLTIIANVVISGCKGTAKAGAFEENYQSTIANFSRLMESLHREIPHDTEWKNTRYDFIIVGSGSAGSVIANRLSEVRNWNILLLEVGNPEGILPQFPLFSPLLQFTDYNWDYTMEPQEDFCLAMINHRCSWPRGRAVGGSSVINYMIYSRGNPVDYDRWAAKGNPGWSYKDVLPYFLKSENARLAKSDPSYHNKGGYLSVEDPFESDLTKTFLEAGLELGYKLVDYNSPQQFGFSRIQANIKRGRRHSVAKAFLKPILHRKNLHILTGAKVTKINIDRTTNKAQGVEYLRKGKTFSVVATKEVIISAGAFLSPQLLMLSGIGPSDHLKELGIPPLIDLPVGKTLYDHISFLGLVFNTNVTIEPVTNLFDPIQLLRWYKTGVGPLSSLGGFEALGYIKTNVSIEEGNYPDIEIILSGAGALHTDYGLINKRTLKISDEYYYRMYLSIEGTPGFTIIPMLLHPKSKGYMKLRSTDHYDYPLFYGNHLTDPEEHDLKTLIAGIRFIIKLCETKAFKKYNTRLNEKPFVGCENLLYNSDDYWKCAIKFLTSTLHHQTSTCKMGPAHDPTSVVNHQLKVHGIGNLRVADTSIIPTALSAHTNAPSVMIGEKASDLIKKEWGHLSI